MNKLRRMLKSPLGFTLIELIVVIVIVGILAIIAIPKFIDLTNQAKASATKASLGAVRSTLYMKYAEAAAAGNPTFPASLASTDFANGTLPINSCNGQDGAGVVQADPGGTATSATDGFWYIQTGASAGQAGAYAGSSGDCTPTTGW